MPDEFHEVYGTRDDAARVPVHSTPCPHALRRCRGLALLAKGPEIRVPRGLSDEETLLVMVHELVEWFMVRRDGLQ